MDPETITTMNEGMIQAVLILIQAIIWIIGLASVLFLIACMVGAGCNSYAERRRFMHLRMKTGPGTGAYDLLVALSGLEYDNQHNRERRKPASIRQS